MADIFDDFETEIIAELGHDFEQKIIAAVKQWKCIYVCDDPDFYNTQQNRLAWIRIAHTLKKTVGDCMGKWYHVLNVYFNEKKDDTTWIHYQSLQEMQPYLSQTYAEMQNKKTLPTPKPTSAQKHVFFSELLASRAYLMSNETTMDQRRQIWKNIADKVNDVPNGVKMPVINWQKFWWEQKQNFGVQSSQIRAKLQLIGTKLDVSKYSAEDLMILKFCGVTPKESQSIITALLNSNVEFGEDGKSIPERCKKCSVTLTQQLPYEYCEMCRKMPSTLCDICSKRHEPKLIVHKVNNWSLMAKNLLPTAFHSYTEIAACTLCSLNLEKFSSQVWRACRVCENYYQGLENLFLPANDILRKTFKDATNIAFSEYDGLPGYICKLCKVQMQQFNNFFLRFERTQIRLRSSHAVQFVGLAPCKPSAKPKTKLSAVSGSNVLILKPSKNGNLPANNGNMPSKNGNVPSSCRNIPSSRGNMPSNNGSIPSSRGNSSAKNGNHPSTYELIGSKNQLLNRGANTLCTMATGTQITSPTDQNTTACKTSNEASPSIVTINGPNSSDAVSPSSLRAFLLTKPKPIPQIIRKSPANTEMGTGKSTPIKIMPQKLSQFAAQSGLSVTKKIIYSGSGAITQIHSVPTNTFRASSTASTTVVTMATSAPIAVSTLSTGPHFAQKPLPKSSGDTSKLLLRSPKTVTAPLTIQTIPVDYQDFEEGDSPPAYCIPKSLTLFRNSHTSVKIMRAAPNVLRKELVPAPIQQNIKTETINDGYPDNSSMPATSITQSPSSSTSTISVKSPIGTPIDNSVVPLNHVQQDNRKSASGPPNKKPRKNWGYVNEFHVSTPPNKTDQSTSKRIQQRRMTIHNTSIAREHTPPSLAHSQTPEQSRPPESSWEIEIKEEPIDNYQISPANDKHSPTKETNHSMFYPDSFELEKFSLSVDVSSMLNDMLTKQRGLNDNLALDADNLKYLNPPLPKSYSDNTSTSTKETRKTPQLTSLKIPVPIRKLQIKLKRVNITAIKNCKNSEKTTKKVIRAKKYKRRHRNKRS